MQLNADILLVSAQAVSIAASASDEYSLAANARVECPGAPALDKRSTESPGCKLMNGGDYVARASCKEGRITADDYNEGDYWCWMTHETDDNWAICDPDSKSTPLGPCAAAGRPHGGCNK
ncbi:hypothetical protein NUU61_002640 [Penicillium alfredii]|uniref:Uncharacterized protein n=1 Tax=Penicillium alfredii TaxID=1506179 RepID=A0A9W9FRY7_9EURO|nr:uncharacterized protein NUU61_002640 [Penicillium alfredii]KAJ5105293.1 hypothetical protein NUU61_002640 [Penicillium alfredii]